MLTATGGPTDLPVVVQGLWGSNMQHTAINVLKSLGHPQIAGILYSSHIVALDLFCCDCRRHFYL